MLCGVNTMGCTALFPVEHETSSWGQTPTPGGSAECQASLSASERGSKQCHASGVYSRSWSFLSSQVWGLGGTALYLCALLRPKLVEWQISTEDLLVRRCFVDFALVFLQTALWRWAVQWYEKQQSDIEPEGTQWLNTTREGAACLQNDVSYESLLEKTFSPAHCSTGFFAICLDRKTLPLSLQLHHPFWSALKSSVVL